MTPKKPENFVKTIIIIRQTVSNVERVIIITTSIVIEYYAKNAGKTAKPLTNAVDIFNSG
jgi:hypothetical protein